MNDVREVVVEVRGMTCEHCERRVAQALGAVPGVKGVRDVNHVSALARVTAGPEATPRLIEDAVEKAGYHARVRRTPDAASNS